MTLGGGEYDTVALAGDDRQKLLRDISSVEPRGPRQLNRAIPVDLETIVGKAMAKEPDARYATAQELADDLKRFPEDKPIRARRPSLATRTAKWGRRHQPVVWAALATLIIVAAALAVSTVLVARAYEAERDQRQRVEEQKRLVEKQKRQADKQKKLADKQTELAIQQRATANWNLYLAHMRLAQQDWKSGQTWRFQKLLDRHVPEADEPDFRGWEWYYLWSSARDDWLTLWGHTGDVRLVRWSPDGRYLSSGSLDGTARVWDADTGDEVLKLDGHIDLLWSIAWSPDGGRCAGTNGDVRQVRIDVLHSAAAFSARRRRGKGCAVVGALVETSRPVESSAVCWPGANSCCMESIVSLLLYILRPAKKCPLGRERFCRSPVEPREIFRFSSRRTLATC